MNGESSRKVRLTTQKKITSLKTELFKAANREPQEKRGFLMKQSPSLFVGW